jgi:hypothetical protein
MHHRVPLEYRARSILLHSSQRRGAGRAQLGDDALGLLRAAPCSEMANDLRLKFFGVGRVWSSSPRWG